MRFNSFVLGALGLAASVMGAPTVEERDLSVADIINALGVGLVKDVNAFFTLDSLTTNVISVNFDVKNPLPIELTIDSVTSQAGLNGTVFATFTHTFPKPGLVVPPLGTKNSGTINNVQLPLGATAALSIVPFQELDLPDTNANVRAATILGALGIPISLTGLKQSDVPTTYDDMARISTLLFALMSCMLVGVFGAPSPKAELENRDFIGDVINLIGLGLVTQINAYITLESLTTDVISVDVDIHNPLLLELTIERIVSNAGLNGTVYSSFDHTFEKPFVIKPLKTANTGSIPNVKLVQGALASLDIIPVGKLDLITTDVYVRAATINGKLGIPIPIKGLKQADVPAKYELILS
ncbi:hypothetical protein CVT24_011694 [Panaeolus cyanescens]|uniref:Late embryogenesis abundant protein LEA-2 subgroup domain-containing protein n=1 Tax=Panaeolus cyanescens TaxID=181874 RepID=A0A409YH66_9AGAR|nr:hypothetical protein CVT24_011694 [Panaeolus cyanescens]